MNAAAQPSDADLHARALSVLARALQHPPAEREDYVRSTCEGDAALREEVLSLLAHDAAASGLEPGAGARMLHAAGSPAGGSRAADATPETVLSGDVLGLRSGATIDRYRLLQEIGEGGFGVVWMAEQQQPVRRKVALKVIKPGMDTKAVVARFEAERQALAMMDHPYIANVLDGGVTESGRPYFVMELVKGLPITTYCDQARSSIEDRLRLFSYVCRALQHAHGKGIIHRDVKPGNVLVTLLDGEPVPKVIDFGIAKATSAELTRRTLFTGFHQMIGTPEYMAPEQTALSALDVDTRADVYSLGVLLYELLTGTRPFDLRTARQRGYEELVRVIREDEPPKPSTRVSTLDETASTVAQLRHLAQRQLVTALRGDLDWIVLKALEKDRERRYETAAGLAEDVERYLASEVVLASPPSARDRLRKLVRRRGKAIAAAAALVLVLLAGTAGTGAGWWNTRRANAALVVALDEKDDALAEEERQRGLAQESEAQALEAEVESETRAAELEQVTGFQAEQLGGIDVATMGLRLRRALLAATPRTVARSWQRASRAWTSRASRSGCSRRTCSTPPSRRSTPRSKSDRSCRPGCSTRSPRRSSR